MANVVCYRGKVTNHDELCVENSIDKDIEDAVLIEKLYCMYGEFFVNLIEGSYAIVISDAGKYLLIRDRVGFKSLYYNCHNGSILYGVNLKEILDKCQEIPQINCNAIYHYLSFWALPEDMTWFENVKKVEPGTYVIFQNGEICKKKYYSFKQYINNIIEDGSEFAEKKINELLNDSIKKKQKRYSIALSGGVDSCLLSALSSKLEKEFDTISVYINENRKNEEIQRIENISKNIAPTTMDYRSCLITEQTVNDAAHWIAQNTFEPMQLLDMMLILSILGNDDKEYMFGEGADELGGYSEYIKASEINELLSRRSTKVYNDRYYKNIYLCRKHVLGLTESQKKKVWKKRVEKNSYEYLYNIANEIRDDIKDSYLRKLQNIDLSFRLPEYLLKRTDTISQLTGTHIDFPYLKRELIEYCVQIDKALMMDKRSVKKVFKSILDVYIESDQWYKTKIGMGDELNRCIEDIVLCIYKKNIEENSEHPLYEYLDREELAELVMHNKYIVWTIYSLGVWLEEISKIKLS